MKNIRTFTTIYASQISYNSSFIIKRGILVNNKENLPNPKVNSPLAGLMGVTASAYLYKTKIYYLHLL